MPADKEERDDSCPALQDIHPVRHPRMADGVRTPFPPDIEAIEAVKQYWQPDAEEFHRDAPRNRLEFAGNVVEFIRADERVTIFEKMLKKEDAYRNNAA